MCWGSYNLISLTKKCISRLIIKLKTQKYLSRVTLGTNKNKHKYLTPANNSSLTNVLMVHNRMVVEL